MTFDVAIPDCCHLKGVSLGEVVAFYADIVLKLDTKPKIYHIVRDGIAGLSDESTILYLHPETDEVLMQVNVSVEKSQKRAT